MPYISKGIVQEDVDKQMNNALEVANSGALMADNHLGYSVPIGSVLVFDRFTLSPSAVGYDIGCGNMALRLDINYNDIKDDLDKILDEIENRISFGVGLKSKRKVEHSLFDNDPAWDIPFVNNLKSLAEDQLGTVGAGNHYVDLFRDELDRIWVGVHFGSRGLGHKITSYFLKQLNAKNEVFSQPVTCDILTDLGEQYHLAMGLAGLYAMAGREYVCEIVSRIIGVKSLDEIHNYHNFAWLELHNGEQKFVIRKGATPNFPGQRSFIGGSMGDISVIVEGKENDEAKSLFYSTVHGAGRVMSRRKAAGRYRIKKGKRVKLSEGEITFDMMNGKLNELGVKLRGGYLDEAPQCYKDLTRVLNYHSNTIDILHTLYPIGVIMAGMEEYDPYKD